VLVYWINHVLHLGYINRRARLSLRWFFKVSSDTSAAPGKLTTVSGDQPSSGGLYTASALLVPKAYRAPVGFVVGWLNLLGQIAGAASTEFGLAQMIWAAYSISKDGAFVA